jgi:hypothetical protein
MDWDAPLEVARPLFLRMRGYGGGVPTFNSLAVLAFGHATAVLLQAWIHRRKQLSTRRAFRVLAASIVAVWFAYYAHRPNASCLSSLLVPYSFLLLDTLRVVVLGLRGRSLGAWKQGLSVASLSLAVVPNVVLMARVQVPAFIRGLEDLKAPPPAGGRLIQGVYIPDDARTRRILEQSEFLRSRPRAEPIVYFTSDNYLVSLESTTWSDVPLPTANAFLGSQTVDHYGELIHAMKRPAVRRVYFDSWSGLSPAEADRLQESYIFYKQLRLRLSATFIHRRTVAGWEEWVRR